VAARPRLGRCPSGPPPHSEGGLAGIVTYRPGLIDALEKATRAQSVPDQLADWRLTLDLALLVMYPSSRDPASGDVRCLGASQRQRVRARPTSRQVHFANRLSAWEADAGGASGSAYTVAAAARTSDRDASLPRHPDMSTFRPGRTAARCFPIGGSRSTRPPTGF
jgi:hypothetical protein